MKNNIPDVARLLPIEDFESQASGVELWRVSLDVLPDSVKLSKSNLSADEIQRASRFRFDQDRERFIVAHASLRGILARHLQAEPSRLEFSTNEYGKPFLPGSEIEFNLSHSGDYALIAVTRGRDVGVDIEQIRAEVEIESLAARYFSSVEVSELLALPLEQRTIGFFNCWTRKEAYIKARGLGLSLPLDSFDVSLSPDQPALLRATRPNANDAAQWTVLSLPIGSGYAGAIAVRGHDLDFRFFDWTTRDKYE
jgi:4'-phosphopantetheinyl transferase